jgi:hypothetical protein
MTTKQEKGKQMTKRKTPRYASGEREHKAACEVAADDKSEAVRAFMRAQFRFSDTFRAMLKLHDKIQRIKKSGKTPSAKLLAAMESTEDQFTFEGKLHDDALDDLILAEMAYRAADKAYRKHTLMEGLIDGEGSAATKH